MASKDDAAKARIIEHMNNDHAESLSLYLQHYAHLSPRASSKPQLTDITFSSLTIQSSSGTHTISITPPMTSWAEARTRTVDMDAESRKALDISPIKVTSYQPPTSPIHVTVFGLCIVAFVSFTTRKWIVPGTFVYDKLLPWYPGGPKVFLFLAKNIALPVLAIHATEAYMLDKTRLRKYGVPRGSGLWWAWMASCFVEGFGCFQRIDAEVKKKTVENENEKH